MSLPCTVAADVLEAFMEQFRYDSCPLCPLLSAKPYSRACKHTKCYAVDIFNSFYLFIHSFFSTNHQMNPP